jgi:hypothetical protein
MSPLGSEFDDFLYASIGEDSNGVLLSVLSALARLDVDPWEEAAKSTPSIPELAVAGVGNPIATAAQGSADA